MPRKDENLFAEMLFGFFVRTPWWTVPIAAILTYILTQIAVLFLWNAFAPFLQAAAPSGLLVLFPMIFVFGVSIIGIAAQFQKKARNRLVEDQKSLETIRELSWRDFEFLVSEAYRRQGMRVIEGQGGPDHGVDLVMSDQAGNLTVVQCKHWKQWKVGEPTVRDLYGTMQAMGASRGILIASGTFTGPAFRWAEGKPIELIGGQGLVDLLSEVQTNGAISREREISEDPKPDCPLCGSAMVKRTARRGPNEGKEFWGCSRFPQCKGTRNIS